MRTIRQVDFCLPLLLEIAIRNGRIEVDRRSSDLNDVTAYLEKLLGTNSESWGRTKNGQGKFRNWMEWARKKLREAGLLTGFNRVDWRITKSGYDRLRELVKSHLCALLDNEKDRADRYLFDIVESCDFCRFNQVLQFLDSSELQSVVHNSSTPYEMFSAAIDGISDDQLADFLLWSYEDLGDWLRVTKIQQVPAAFGS
jgi:Mrr N-terminal domain